MENNSEQQTLHKEFEKHVNNLKTRFHKIFKECCKTNKEFESFKKHYLPLARIKKVMKTDEDVKVQYLCILINRP